MKTPLLEAKDIKGLFGIMPTPATPNASDYKVPFTVNLQETARAVDSLVKDGINAIMITGTLGEGSTLNDAEWRAYTATVAKTVNGRIPVICGPTTLNTRATIERAKFGRDVGASGMLLGLPMWQEMPIEAIIEFYQNIAEAVPELGIIVYDNPGAFKVRHTPELWKQLLSIPQVVAAKIVKPDQIYVDSLNATRGKIKLMPTETAYPSYAKQFPDYVNAFWSSKVGTGPLAETILRDLVVAKKWDEANKLAARIEEAGNYFPKDFSLFLTHNIQLEKVRSTASGYMNAGPARPPYHLLPKELEQLATAAGTRLRDLNKELKEHPIEAVSR
jgi:hypothetical protein